MSEHMSVFAVMGLAAIAACSDGTRIVQPAGGSLRTPHAAASLDTHPVICSFAPTPSSLSVYVGGSVGLNGGEEICDDSTGHFLGWGFVNFFSTDASVGSLSPGYGTSTTITGVADGSTTVQVVSYDGQYAYVPLTVTHAPLTGSVSGLSNVNTNRNCDYSVGASGGYPPYSGYSWTVDGTIVSGQGTSSVTVNFTSDGNHLVSVDVTDSHSVRTTAALWVTSSTQDPTQLTCGVT